MSSGDMKLQRRELAAKAALTDIRWLLTQAEETSDSIGNELDTEELLRLFRKNFDRLDNNGNGISREELTAAMMRPGEFTKDEYVMLKLLTKYFDTIVNMSDDQQGEETVITLMDGRVLAQFLRHSKFSLAELHMWVNLAKRKKTDQDMEPPPMSGR